MARILVLGGTFEAMHATKARALSAPQDHFFYALKGLTEQPNLPTAPNITPILHGFTDGIGVFLSKNQIDEILVGLHPFSQRMRAQAYYWAKHYDLKISEIAREKWQGVDEYMIDGDDLCVRINQTAGRVLCALGSQHLMPLLAQMRHDDCWLRALRMPEAPYPNFARIILAGVQDYQAEYDFLRDNQIRLLVCRESMGAKSFAKIAAARALKIDCAILRLK